MLAMMLRWDSITPLGWPSLPLEKRIAAVLSCVTRFMYSSLSSQAGNSTACSSVARRRPLPICCMKSSSGYTVVPATSAAPSMPRCVRRSRKRREVNTVRMPAFAIAACTASALAV